MRVMHILKQHFAQVFLTPNQLLVKLFDTLRNDSTDLDVCTLYSALKMVYS